MNTNQCRNAQESWCTPILDDYCKDISKFNLCGTTNNSFPCRDPNNFICKSPTPITECISVNGSIKECKLLDIDQCIISTDNTCSKVGKPNDFC